MVLAIAIDPWVQSQQGVAVASALLIPVIVIRSNWLGQMLASRPLRYVGTRSYAVYLIHPVCKNAVDLAIAPGGDNALVQVARLLLTFGISLVGAEVLYRLVEQPMIRLGRRVSHNRRTTRVLPIEAPATR